MTTRTGATPAPVRRYDPHRRDRIIDACLEVVAEAGVAGTSHRKVAEAADVPLGSMTYHFSSINELLNEAFSRFAVGFGERFAERMAAGLDRDAAVEAVVAAILVDIPTARRELVLTHELYALAARDTGFREITDVWTARRRTALERHFDSGTARILDALIDGLTVHRALDNAPPDDNLVRVAVARVIQPTPGEAC